MTYNVGMTGRTPEELAVIAGIRAREEQERLAVESERRRILDEQDERRRAMQAADQAVRDQRDGPFNDVAALLMSKFEPEELGRLATVLQRVDLRRLGYWLHDRASDGLAAQRKRIDAERMAASKASKEYEMTRREAEIAKRAEADLLRGIAR